MRWRNPGGSGWGAWLSGAGLLLVVASPQHYRDELRYRAPNEESRVYGTLALVDHGTLQLEPVLDREMPAWRQAVPPPNIDLARREGHYYTDKAPGISLGGVPVVAALRLLGLQPGYAWLTWILTLCLAAAPSVLFAVFFGRWLRRQGAGSPLAADLVACGMLLATPWLAYAGLLFGHALAATLFGLGACLSVGPLWRCGETERDRPPETWGRSWQPLLGGLCLGGSVLTELPAAALVVCVCIAIGIDPGRRRRLAPVALGLLPALAILAVWNTLAFGGPLQVSYRHKALPRHAAIVGAGLFGFSWPSPGRLAELMVRPARGLLFLSPWLLAAFAGAMRAVRHARLAPAWRILLVAGVFGFPVLVSGFVDWKAGATLGPRHLMPALPLFALAAWLGLAPRQGHSGPGEFLNAVVSGLLVSSFGACLVGAWVYPYFDEFSTNPLFEVSLPVLLDGGPGRTVWGSGAIAWTALVAAALTGGAALIALAARWTRAERPPGRRQAARIAAAALVVAAVHLFLASLPGSPKTPEARRRLEIQRGLVHRVLGQDRQADVLLAGEPDLLRRAVEGPALSAPAPR